MLKFAIFPNSKIDDSDNENVHDDTKNIKGTIKVQFYGQEVRNNCKFRDSLLCVYLNRKKTFILDMH